MMTDTPSTEALTQRALERQGVRVRKYDGEEWVSLHDWAESCARQEAADTSGLLRLVAGRIVTEYDKTLLTHDVAYEDVVAEIDQLRLVLAGRDHPGLRPEYRAALAQPAPERPLDVVHCRGCVGYFSAHYLEREPCPGVTGDPA